MSHEIALIVGLGNPGQQYEATRHNVGYWFTDRLCEKYGGNLSTQSKFLGKVAQITHQSNQIRILQPTTYMNLSGQSVTKVAQFYKIPPQAMLVIHDDLDLPPGAIRLKFDGGHGGHNGLRDIISHFKTKQFYRLRIGIGHPGHKSEVHNFVLKRPTQDEERAISDGIDKAMQFVPEILSGQLQKAMNHLHTETNSK